MSGHHQAVATILTLSKGNVGSLFKSSTKIFIVFEMRKCNPKAYLTFLLAKGQGGGFEVLMMVIEDDCFV
jgi:hypothetical protein